MKKTSKTVLVLTLVIAMLITLAACSSGGSNIVGRWTKTGGSGFSYLEFFSDGTYTSDHPNYKSNYSIDGDRLKLSGVLVEDRTYTFKIEGDTLSLYYSSESDSPVLVLKKN